MVASRVGAALLRILLVSDDLQLRALLSQVLAAHHYDVVTVGSSGLPSVRAAGWDAVILDTAAKRGAARWLRTQNGMSRVPTIAIAAANNAALAPLWSRVDAVLHEPFDARKVLLIVRGLFAGRRRASAPDRGLTMGPVRLDSLLNTATVETREIALTDTETRVLRELMFAACTPVPRDRLMRCALGRDGSPDDRCLDTHIKRLRRKIGHDAQGRTPIRTVRGIGYLLLEQWQPAG